MHDGIEMRSKSAIFFSLRLECQYAMGHSWPFARDVIAAMLDDINEIYLFSFLCYIIQHIYNPLRSENTKNSKNR
jgi:hypothetical protein